MKKIGMILLPFVLVSCASESVHTNMSPAAQEIHELLEQDKMICEDTRKSKHEANMEKREAIWKKILQLNPEYRSQFRSGKFKLAAIIYYNGVHIYLEGRNEDAIKKWREVLELVPDHLSAKQAIIKASKELGVESGIVIEKEDYKIYTP